jgi:hypothetical protein
MLLKIDDISVRYGNCQSKDYEGVSCNFEEEHICGYKSDTTGNFNWIRNKGET